MVYLFYAFKFNLFLSLYLKWVFCSQHIIGPCFFKSNLNLCLLIGVIKQFTFNVISDMVGLDTILLFVSYWLHLFSPGFTWVPLPALQHKPSRQKAGVIIGLTSFVSSLSGISALYWCKNCCLMQKLLHLNKYYMIPLIWGTESSQNHRDRK